jgi:hypothetical protein
MSCSWQISPSLPWEDTIRRSIVLRLLNASEAAALREKREAKAMKKKQKKEKAGPKSTTISHTCYNNMGVFENQVYRYTTQNYNFKWILILRMGPL